MKLFAPKPTVFCPECNWDESIRGEPVYRATAGGGSEISGQGMICVSCGAKWVNSEMHGQYLAGKRVREAAYERQEAARVQAGTRNGPEPKAKDKMPPGMAGMRARPEG